MEERRILIGIVSDWRVVIEPDDQGKVLVELALTPTQWKAVLEDIRYELVHAAVKEAPDAPH